MSTLLKDKKLIFGILLILFFAFLIRIINLTSIPVFADEAIYIRWAQVMKAESTLRFLPLSDGKQPLFMWVAIPFLKIISNPLLAGRLVSVFCGVGTVLGVFVLSYILFNSKKISIFASILYAVIPFSFFFDRMALVDSMLAFFSIWTVILSILTLKTLRLDLAMIGGFFMGGAFLTKSPAIFIAILIPTVLILGSRETSKVKNLFKVISLFVVTYFIAFAIQNILRLGPNFEQIALRNKDYVYPISHFFTNPMDPTVSHLKDTFNWIIYLLPFPLLFFLPFVNIKKFRVLIFLYLFFVIPVFAESALAKVYTARYILFTIPFLVIFFSSAFIDNSGKLKKFIYIIFALVVLTSLYQNYLLITNPQKALLPVGERSGYLEDWTAGYGISEVADYVRSEYLKDPSKKIVIGTEGYFGTLPDGLQIYLNDLRDVVVVGVGLGINKTPQSLIESKMSGNKTYLVINSTRLVGSPEEMGLRKISSFKKAIKHNGYQEELLFFEVK